VFGAAQAFMNESDPAEFLHSTTTQEIRKLMPSFAGLVDPALGIALTMATDFASDDNGTQLPPCWLQALSIIAFAQLQPLVDVNGGRCPHTTTASSRPRWDNDRFFFERRRETS
jgi:hypothetical protein